jgi:hypothetical protein
MSGRPIPIFYEDSWGAAKEFGLHELIVSCVADIQGKDWWERKGNFEAIPKKGVNNLLAACRDDVPDMRDPLIIAVFDSDKLHRHLFASGRPSESELLAKLREQCPHDRLHVFLIAHNTETVVEAVAVCIGEPPPPKDTLLRDRLLTRAARDAARQSRDCTRAAVPSFDACVRRIAELTA